MPRTISTAERAAVRGLRLGAYAKLEIEDSTGAFVDVSSGLRNVDWLNSVKLSETQDDNAATLSGSLLSRTGALSLAPFRSDSLLNQVGGSYATMLDVWRRWKLSCATMPPGTPPTGSDWKGLAEGRIDVIDVKENTIDITGRTEEVVLLQRWIDTPRQYGSVGGIAMETVIQSMLDDNLGSGVITLYCPVSPSYLMNSWTQLKGNLMQALTAVAEKAGFVLRYRYDSAGTYRLTLFKPNRTATVEDWSLGPDEYLSVPLSKIDLSGVRNFIKLRFVDATLGTQTVISPSVAGTGTLTAVAGAGTFSSSQAGVIANGYNVIVAGIPFTVSGFSGTTTCTLSSQEPTGGVPTFAASAFSRSTTSTSITRFGRVDMEIDLSYETQVNTAAKAQAMCDAVRSDLEFPDLEQQIETIGFWFVQLHDYGRFYANGIQSDTDQLAGITSIDHDLTGGMIKTTLGARGKPSGRYTTWRNLSRATVRSTSAIPPLRRTAPLDDGKFATVATDSSGVIIDSSVQQNLAGTPRAIAKGYQAGFVADAGAVTFNPVYQNLPQVLMRGGKDGGAGTYPSYRADGLSASGFTCRARIITKGVITPQTAEFTASLTTSTVGGTIGPATIGATPAYDSNYTARFGISVTLTGGPGQVIAVVAVEANDGVSGYIERATRSYTAGTSAGTYNYTAQQVPISDSTLGAADLIRLKLKSITVSGPGGTTGSATLEGYNNSPGAEGHGLLYNTSTGSDISKTPDVDDLIFWESFEVVS